MAMLEVDGLTHTYGQGPTAHRALGGISCVVHDGELVCIVGPSGCGKTTLLRSIAGLMRPTSGRVTVSGTVVAGRVPQDLAVVFQDYSRSLYPWMSVQKNVEFPLHRRGLNRGTRKARAAEALSAVGRSGCPANCPVGCSSGWRSPARSPTGPGSC